jgi:hypothetical protein
MVRHRLFAAVAFAALSIHAAPLLTATGYGALRLGMTRGQAERAIGAHVSINDIASDDAWVCANGFITTMPHVDLLLEGLRIKVISIGGGRATADGVRIGTSEAQLRRIFGTRAVFTWRPYAGGAPGAHNIIVKTGRNREFLFQTGGGRVETISIGDLPAVEYWEGCA